MTFEVMVILLFVLFLNLVGNSRFASNLTVDNDVDVFTFACTLNFVT